MALDTERFIVEIENRPAIWDTSSNEHADRELKKKCWEEVVEIFKEKEDMTTQEKKDMGDALQKKWKSIRGCFMREVARQKALMSGAGVGSRKSEYIYFKQLQFLRKVTDIRESTHPTDPEGEQSQNDLSRDQFRPQKKPKRENKPESGDEPLLKVLNKPIEQREKHDFEEQDEDKLFLLSLVTTLKKVPEHKKIATKIKMMALLEEATQDTPHTFNWSQHPHSSQNYPPQLLQHYQPGYLTHHGASSIVHIPSPEDYHSDSSLLQQSPSNEPDIKLFE